MLRQLSSKAQRSLKSIETVLCWYSLDISCWVRSYENPCARVSVIFQGFFALFWIGQISHPQHKGYFTSCPNIWIAIHRMNSAPNHILYSPITMFSGSLNTSHKSIRSCASNPRTATGATKIWLSILQHSHPWLHRHGNKDTTGPDLVINISKSRAKR